MMDFSRCHIVQRSMEPPRVVEVEIADKPLVQRRHVQILLEIDILIFQTPPEPLDHNIVRASALPVHADKNGCSLQNPCEIITGELTSLISIENLRLAPGGGVKPYTIN